MASLESVAAKAKARTEAHQALITEARNAVTAGIPKAAVAGPYPRIVDTGCDYAAVGSVAARRAS